MKKKISLAEKLRRSKQGQDKTLYHDGNGGTFSLDKVKGGFKMVDTDGKKSTNTVTQ